MSLDIGRLTIRHELPSSKLKSHTQELPLIKQIKLSLVDVSSASVTNTHAASPGGPHGAV